MNAIFQSFFHSFFYHTEFVQVQKYVHYFVHFVVGIDCGTYKLKATFLNEKTRSFVLTFSPQNAENRILGLGNFKLFP